MQTNRENSYYIDTKRKQIWMTVLLSLLLLILVFYTNSTTKVNEFSKFRISSFSMIKSDFNILVGHCRLASLLII